MIYPENFNRIDIFSRTNMPLNRVFHDHKSKYPATKGGVKRKILEEMSRLVKCYLPKNWALVLIGLSSITPTIIEEGFKGLKLYHLMITLKGS